MDRTAALSAAVALAMLAPIPTSASAQGRYCPEVAREIREGRREVYRERREARRDIIDSNSRWGARRDAREGIREIDRERREARREIRREMLECQLGY